MVATWYMFDNRENSLHTPHPYWFNYCSTAFQQQMKNNFCSHHRESAHLKDHHSGIKPPEQHFYMQPGHYHPHYTIGDKSYSANVGIIHLKSYEVLT